MFNRDEVIVTAFLMTMMVLIGLLAVLFLLKAAEII
jgi:hypothetical protein